MGIKQTAPKTMHDSFRTESSLSTRHFLCTDCSEQRFVIPMALPSLLAERDTRGVYLA